MNAAFSIALTLCFPLCLLAWISAVFCMFKTVANLKPEVRLWQDAPWSNPMNHILVTEHLTETGLKYRRRLVFSVLTFVLPILFLVAFAAASGQLD